MLRLDAKKIFAARAIEKPQGFLRNRGFSPHTASDLVTGRTVQIKFKVLERLRMVLNCTPHDLLVWEPDEGVKEPQAFELRALIKDKEIIKINEQLRGMTLTDVAEVNRFVLEMRKQKYDK